MKVVDVTRGNMAWIKTKGVYPLFKKWGINTKNGHRPERVSVAGYVQRLVL